MRCGSLMTKLFVGMQELRGEMWIFDDKAICFANGVLVGGPQDLLHWAEEEHSYENFRPLSLYSTLAEEAYHLYRTSSRVALTTLIIDIT